MAEQPPLEFNVHYQSREGEVRVILGQFEVMRVLFSRDNFSAGMFEKLKHTSPFLTLTDDMRERVRAKVREAVAREGRVVTDEFMEASETDALRQLELMLIKESIETATKGVNDNLQNVVNVMWRMVLQAAGFAGANVMRDLLAMQGDKYSAKAIKDALWDEIKPLAGVTHGGARPRKAQFVWDTEKALQLYQTVETLPRYGANNRPMWEHAREALRDNDYDHDTIQFLKSRPAYQDVPEELLKEAANVWRQYDDSWDTLPPENSPLAFAFRHACHKLDFPYTAYNTVRTNYYKGKKAAEGKG